MTEIVALISTYDEEDILGSAIESVRGHVGYTVIFDGPTNVKGTSYAKKKDSQDMSSVRYSGEWNSDAHKRTSMLLFAKALYAKQENVWGLWLDGDEVLIWGQFLKDHCKRAEEETATGGTTLRIVEYDGSVALCYGKLVKLSEIAKYVVSSYEIELSNGMTVALPNVPICYAGGLPYGNIQNVDDPLLARNRPPVQGEPHLLHRHGLRSPHRDAERLHETEAESFQTLVRQAGLEGVDKSTVERI